MAMRSPKITYVDRLQPTSLEWNLFPKVSTPSVIPEVMTPEPSVPLWLQGARIMLREPSATASTSKCFCPPPPWMDAPSRPERQPESGHQANTEKKESKEKAAKTPDGAAAPSKPSDFRCPDPRADSQDQQSRSPGHPKGVHGVRMASSETKAADQAETEDEMSIKRKNILVNEVERIFAIKERKHKFDWIPILGLESGFRERDMDRRKRALLLILHPDKSAKFAKHAGGEERLKTAYDFVDVAYLDAKKWLDQKNNGYLPPWERDPFSQAAAQPWQPPTRARPAAWTHGTYGASVSPRPPTTPTTTPTTPTTPRAKTPPPRKAAPPPPKENFNKASKRPF